jgi:dextranase
MRALAPGKTAILAAYVLPYKDPAAGDDGRENAALLARAVISANGGDHFALGERGAILRVPYYADYARYRASFGARLRDWQDFIVRYRDLLFDPALEDVSRTWIGGINEEIRVSGPPVSVDYRAGTVGLSATRGAAGLTISFVNLCHVANSLWNEAKPDQAPAEDLAVDVLLPGAGAGGFWASPDAEGGDERGLSFERIDHPQGTALRCVVPGPRLWSILHIPFAQ